MLTCFFENNAKALRGFRHVTVGAIAVNKKQQVLLIKRAKHLHNGGKYAIPGGFLDRNEDTKQAALRELKEETGLKGEVDFLFKINDNPNRPKEDRQNVDFLYIVKILGGQEKISPETSNIEWFNKETLPAEEEFAFDHRNIILEYLNTL
ncbi:NUDIX hydrolase [Patescibacteria group bacterium]|nr:NUDIX hydrolase [Patescibacteria group bacterium]